MQAIIRCLGWMTLSIVILLFLAALWTRFNPVFINTTKSLPLGIYIQSDEPVEKGAYVAFCPPDSAIFAMARERGFIDANNGINNGHCDSGHGLMLKQVVAVKGDLLSIDREGVIVNEQNTQYEAVGDRFLQSIYSCFTIGESARVGIGSIASG